MKSLACYTCLDTSATIVTEYYGAWIVFQAEAELSEAEPALLSAKRSVRSIKKPQLDEIRTLTRCAGLLRHSSSTVSALLGAIALASRRN